MSGILPGNCIAALEAAYAKGATANSVAEALEESGGTFFGVLAHTEGAGKLFVAHHVEMNRDIVVLSGTETVEDWLHNINITTSQNYARGGGDLKLHAGFLAAIKNHLTALGAVTPPGQLLPSDLAIRNALGMTGIDIVLIGHSLGAAMATILGIALEGWEFEGNGNVDVVGFGCPGCLRPVNPQQTTTYSIDFEYYSLRRLVLWGIGENRKDTIAKLKRKRSRTNFLIISDTVPKSTTMFGFMRPEHRSHTNDDISNPYATKLSKSVALKHVMSPAESHSVKAYDAWGKWSKDEVPQLWSHFGVMTPWR